MQLFVVLTIQVYEHFYKKTADFEVKFSPIQTWKLNLKGCSIFVLFKPIFVKMFKQ